jgi:hypothetical protein
MHTLDALPAGFADEAVILLKIAAAGETNGRIDKLDNRLEDGSSDVQISM